MKRLRLFLLLAHYLFFSLSLWADVTLKNLMLETGTRLVWDSELQIGTLKRDDTRVRFSPETPLLLLNYETTLSIDAPRYNDGQVTFTDETARIIYDFFAVNREDRNYQVSVILLDPGHGGKDWGAYRKTMVDDHELYLKEKNINLDMAMRLEALLKEKYPDKTIALTRRDDTYVTLKDRVAIAESYNFSPQEGMVFLSIHTNASLNKEARGFEVWYLPDDVERELADDGENDQVSQVLNTLWEGIFTRECYNFARFLMERIGSQFDDSFPSRGLKRELWYVLRNKNMVSALAELAFVSNSLDVPLLQDEQFLDDYATALSAGIGDFIDYFEN